MPTPPPRSIELNDREQTLRVQWQDGERSVYPLDGLRRACPCVYCQGGHGQMESTPEPLSLDTPAIQEWHDVKLEAAGSVGLRITWDDGHNDGIYTWRRLRALAPENSGEQPEED